VATISVEAVKPPSPPGPLTWLRENLFSNWFNSILTVISLAFVVWGSISAIRWVFFSADWTPVVRSPLLFLVGQYPRESLWRVGASLTIVSFLAGVSWRQWGGFMRAFVLLYAAFLLIGVFWSPQGETLTLPMRIFLGANLGIIFLGYLVGGLKFITPRLVVIAWSLSVVITLLLLNGFSKSSLLPHIPTGLWGGLMVTLILAVGGIVLSFPIGVILALGRRSSLPVVKWFSIIFIEVVRGVPLIGILFLSSVALPLFLPQDMRVDLLLRALVGMTLFSAAYMAENVRGGLAAIPPGQEEAAKALGLNNFQITTLIVLPQALRAVIPPIVGQFISLFKDTTLASGVAVLEFLAIGRSIVQSNPAYVSKQTEVLIFIAAVFWIFCYMLSYASLRLEAALGVGER
jgi:general L-amino acid transport system permease protein